MDQLFTRLISPLRAPPLQVLLLSGLEGSRLGDFQVLGQVVLLDCADGKKERVVIGRESRMTGVFN